ncbi:DEAD/DEAH box helicase [Tenacibaculum ovolyticum]|uniref:DEAD/DEAH box helicase n=1 Tax=Tenacibaculum ovolyticum TaxID=104270 RepID=UPI003BA94C5A
MYKENKSTFTRIFNNRDFSEILKKITIEEELIEEEKTFILSCALAFLDKYVKDKRYITYLDFAYYIILKYSLTYKDYKPLYDFSVNMGFYPISKVISKNELISLNSLNTFLVDFNIESYFNGEYYETIQQKREKSFFLNDPSDEKAFIAPTSFGKSSLIIDYVKSFSKKKIAIIVPTKSLLSQTYKMIRDSDLDYKILIHDEMYDKQLSFIAVFTQERALRLLAKNEGLHYDIIVVDEAHNMLDNDSRSILLSRLIIKNKNLNPNTKIIYLTPLIKDISTLKVNKEQSISAKSIDFNIKEPEIFEYRKNGNIIKHNRFFIRKSDNNGLGFKGYKINRVKNYYQYIRDNSMNKNFLYNNRPIGIEKLALSLSTDLALVNDENMKEVLRVLKKEVHKDFYGIKTMKKGIVYIHGKLPDLLKEYLEYKFKLIKALKYIVANNVILEGINLPIDSLFIFSTYRLKGKNLTNLIGRVNRLNNVFKGGENNLEMLLPKVHFVNNEEYNNNNDMFNKILTLRSRIYKDEVKNPILEDFDINSIKDSDKGQQELKREKIVLKQENESFLFEKPKDLSSRLKQYFIEYGIDNVYKDLIKIVGDVNEFLEEKKFNEKGWVNKTILEKVADIFIKDMGNIKDFEFKRIGNYAAIRYYTHFIEVNRKKPLNENIINLYSHFKERAKLKNEKKRKFYFGTSYGEEPYASVEYGNPKFNTYIDVKNVKDNKRLINLAIIKLKMEEDFISFTLNKFIVFLYDFNLITTDEYHEYIYGTTNSTKIAMTKFGLNISLITRLEEDKQMKNLEMDGNNNLIANEKFRKYLNKLNDFHRFEVERFLN